MVANVQAPTFDQVALKAGAAEPAAVNHDRVVAGIRFGWALEELVWYLGQVNPTPPGSGAQAGPDYPPDLNHERSAEEHVRELAGLLAADGKTLLASATVPQSAMDLAADVTNLLRAYEGGQDLSNFLLANSATRVARHSRLLDADIVDAIIGEPPEIVTAYELGKALSWTSRRIATATAPTAEIPDPVQDAWSRSLNKDRIEQVRRHLTTLAGALDSQTVIAISASLSFWRRAYYNGELVMPDPTASPRRSTSTRRRAGLFGMFRPARKARTLTQPTTPLFPPQTEPERRKVLLNTLDQQLNVYYDLLTDRRRLDSFPVTAVASNLVHQYASAQFTQLEPFLARLGLIVGAAVLVGIVIYLVLGATVSAGLTGAGLTGGITTLVGLFVARGAGLLDSGRQTVQNVEARSDEALHSTAAGLSFESLGRTVIGQVVAQIRLEESKLAISQPLINLVMTGELSKGPDEVTRIFLQRIMENDEDTNLDRLQNVLQGLYHAYKPVLPGAL